ncbi:MAG: transposase [Gemmataceae bacterium]
MLMGQPEGCTRCDSGEGQRERRGMKRKGCAWFGVGSLAAAILAHVLLSAFPNRDDTAVEAIRGIGGEARRTPRLLWLAAIADACDAFYPRGDVWSVELRDAEVSPGVADGLSTLRSLQSLDLYRCRLPPGMTVNLVPPSGSLRSVYAYNTNLGDPHVVRLGDCPSLVYLFLDGTEVTDASIPTIIRCRTLGHIVLRRNKITEAGIAAIRAAFPRANVVTEEVEAGCHPPGVRRHPGRDAGRGESPTRVGRRADDPVAVGHHPRPDGEKMTFRAAEQDRPDVAAGPTAWRAVQPALDPDRVVVADETRAITRMTRRRGPEPEGGAARPSDHARPVAEDHVHRRPPGRRGVAPIVIDGAMTGDLLVANVRQVLVPALRPGDVVVWDNLACYRRADACAAIEAAGCDVRFLPPYSPDLSPIELAFAMLKARLWAAAKRSIRAVKDYLGELSVAFVPKACRNYFPSCGYNRYTFSGTALERFAVGCSVVPGVPEVVPALVGGEGVE